MSAITTGGSGNWSSTTPNAPWPGGTVPVEGDTVTIASGHTVTIDQNITIGADTTTAAIQVASGGKLQYLYTAAAAYTLTLKGDLKVAGTMEIGTVANPIGSSLGLTIAANYSASPSDGKYGIIIQAGGTCTMQGASKSYDRTLLAVDCGGTCSTSGTAVTRKEGTSFTGKTGTMTINGSDYTISSVTNGDALVLTGSAGVQTNVSYVFQSDNNSLTTADSTGWADNDVIAIASTDRTNTHCEVATLNGAASGTAITLDGGIGSDGGLEWGHMGTSPVQAEVINLTRNIVVTAQTTTAVTWFVSETTATTDIDWVEFKYLGEDATDKRGIVIKTTTGSFNMQRCSIHDTEDYAVYVGINTYNWTFSYNVMYNVSTLTGYVGAFYCANGDAQTAITCTYNIIMLAGSGSVLAYGYQITTAGGTFTNLTCVGAKHNSFNIGTSTATGQVSVTVSYLTAHSGDQNLFYINASGLILSNITGWRCNSGYGVYATGGYFIVNTASFFGNSNYNVYVTQADLLAVAVTSNSETIFTTASGLAAGGSGSITAESCDLSTVSGMLAAHTNDLVWASGGSPGVFVAINCKLGASTETSRGWSVLRDQVVGHPRCPSIRVQRRDQSAGSHYTYYPAGLIEIENTTYKTAAPSVKATPSSASVKLKADSKIFRVDNGDTLTPTVWVRKSTGYNGNAPRLVVRKNVAAGITSDTVLDTFTAAADTWEQLTGTTAAVTDDVALEVFVDCDGTAGNIFVDDWART